VLEAVAIHALPEVSVIGALVVFAFFTSWFRSRSAPLSFSLSLLPGSVHDRRDLFAAWELTQRRRRGLSSHSSYFRKFRKHEVELFDLSN
jgi:hypothetical protein